jgi:hypothetical protein
MTETTDHDLVLYIQEQFDRVNWKTSTDEHLITVLENIARAMSKHGYRGGEPVP